MSGKHDLERLGQLASSLDIPACVVINKYDLSEEHSMEIEDLCRSINLPVLGRFPFSKSIVDTISERKIPLEEMKPQIDEIWNKLILQRKYLQESVER
jgi:MinD superfamily P-loop ATPase